jgi:two-component system response regulator MprA
MCVTLQRILVVDDDETFRLIAREALLRKGYSVVEASDGSVALETARRFPPDLVSVDIMLPGVDGVALCRELREIESLKYAPILVVTALNDPKVLNDALRFGADAYLLKPIEAPIYVDKIQKLLAAPPRRAGSTGK